MVIKFLLKHQTYQPFLVRNGVRASTGKIFMVLTVFQASIACDVKTDENPYVIFKKPVRISLL